jgi:hypothetical protein
MASDAELDNQISHAAHRRLGYAEIERIVCFRKLLLAAQPEEANGETTPRT